MRIDLNSDVGESFGAYTIGADAEVIASVTSINVACGFHAGDPSVMRRTVRLAKAAGVAVGAHPGFPDLVGFGRRELKASPQEVEDFVLYQIGALGAVARAEGIELQHVKAHGALYNMACADRPLADAIVRAVVAFDRRLILFGLPDSHLLRAGIDAGLAVAAEAFADRAYEPDGTLTPRSLPGAVIHDPDAVVERVVRFVTEQRVLTRAGTELTLSAQTVCTHGDNPGAVAITRALRRGLEARGISVQALR